MNFWRAKKTGRFISFEHILRALIVTFGTKWYIKVNG